MSKFSDLIQKKNEMLKVTMKVDPAACKNGEITHFKEYVGFVLAEQEFEKTYEKLLKQYTLQNEGFFDAVGRGIKAVANNPIVNNPITRRLAKDIIDPFKSDKYNPFVGGEKEEKLNLPEIKKEYVYIIDQIESDFTDINKKIKFKTSDNRSDTKTFNDLTSKIRNENYSYNNLSYSLLEKINISPNPRTQPKIAQSAPMKNAQQTPRLPSSPQPQQSKQSKQSQNAKGSSKFSPKAKTPVVKQQPVQKEKELDYNSIIKRGITQTDLNKQLSIKNKQNEYIPIIEKKIKEANAKLEESGKKKIDVKAQDIWKSLSERVEISLRPYLNLDNKSIYKKILWTYILARPDQEIILNTPKSK